MKPQSPNDPVEAVQTTVPSAPKPEPEKWEEFLEDDADCCSGCHHKPR